jgi:hypothetical protein
MATNSEFSNDLQSALRKYMDSPRNSDALSECGGAVADCFRKMNEDLERVPVLDTWIETVEVAMRSAGVPWVQPAPPDPRGQDPEWSKRSRLSVDALHRKRRDIEERWLWRWNPLNLLRKKPHERLACELQRWVDRHVAEVCDPLRNYLERCLNWLSDQHGDVHKRCEESIRQLQQTMTQSGRESWIAKLTDELQEFDRFNAQRNGLLSDLDAIVTGETHV